MTIYVSPAERADVHLNLGEVSSIPEEYGSDFFWVGDGGKLWGVQRKAFPHDLSSSLSDGRFAKELNQMSRLDYPWVAFEGHRITFDGEFGGGITAKQLTGIEARLTMDGIGFQWARDHAGSADWIAQLYHYSMKPEHDSSLRRRPKGPKDEWGNVDNLLTQMWILESFPGISAKRARAIIDHFGRLPLMFDVTELEMIEVPGLGPKIVESMYGFLGRQDATETTEVKTV